MTVGLSREGTKALPYDGLVFHIVYIVGQGLAPAVVGANAHFRPF